MENLDVDLRNTIDARFRESKALIDAGQGDEGVRLGELAWQMLPEPKFGWDVSKSFTHALAQTYRDVRRYEEALALMDDLFSSGTVKPYQDEPYYITGTIRFEMGDLDAAWKWFDDANRLSRGRCFQGEDRRYRDFYRSRRSPKRAKPPRDEH